MLHSIIMAGGAGTRFWPASRKATPKQLLSLFGESTMIEQTVERLSGLTPPERTLVITSAALVDAVGRAAPSLPVTSIVGEPCRRDTAPCIGLAAMLVQKTDPDATMVVLPADHIISPREAFQSALEHAARLVEAAPKRLVTFGIKPTYAAESFGYIERGNALPPSSPSDSSTAYQVVRFKEKPDSTTAESYLKSGNFYWNSGIFAWKAATILEAIADRAPKMLEHLKRISDAWGTKAQQTVFDSEFTAIDRISIDYAVMENATDVAVIEAPFEWDDVGSWQALARLLGTDDVGNTSVGKHLAIDTHGTIVRTEGDHLVATIGLEDCIIVHTANATLVAKKSDEEKVREVVKAIEAKGWSEYL